MNKVKFDKSFFRRTVSYSELKLVPENKVELKVDFQYKSDKPIPMLMVFHNVCYINYSNGNIDFIKHKEDISEVIDVTIEPLKKSKLKSLSYVQDKMTDDYQLLCFHSECDLTIVFDKIELKNLY